MWQLQVVSLPKAASKVRVSRQTHLVVPATLFSCDAYCTCDRPIYARVGAVSGVVWMLMTFLPAGLYNMTLSAANAVQC